MKDLPKRLPIWPGAPTASQPRPHVHQVHGPDCAIAAAATITGMTYEQAASVAFSLRGDGLGGMRPDRIVELLYRLTDVPWQYKTDRSFIRLRDMIFPGDLVIAGIRDPWLFRGAHAIVARDRTVYDGSLDEPVSTQDHPRKKWLVLGVIVRGI
jgi:hypothetical protein